VYLLKRCVYLLGCACGNDDCNVKYNVRYYVNFNVKYYVNFNVNFNVRYYVRSYGCWTCDQPLEFPNTQGTGETRETRES
jgi:hypothetical protein